MQRGRRSKELIESVQPPSVAQNVGFLQYSALLENKLERVSLLVTRRWTARIGKHRRRAVCSGGE
jgi:hypothetical protein